MFIFPYSSRSHFFVFYIAYRQNIITFPKQSEQIILCHCILCHFCTYPGRRECFISAVLTDIHRMSTLPFLLLSGLACLPSGLPKKVEGGSEATGLLHNGQPGKESGGLWQWDRGESTAFMIHPCLAVIGAVMSTDSPKQEVRLSS